MSVILEKEVIFEDRLGDDFDSTGLDAQDEVEQKARSRTPIYIVGGIVIAISITAFAWWLYARQFVKTDDAFIQGSITQVSPKIAAQVAAIYVQENQFVKKGDLLIELEAGESQARLDQAKAAYDTALANHEKAKAGAALVRLTGEAGLDQASSNLQAARKGIEQTKIQSSSRGTAIEQARNQSEIAGATLRQAEAQIPAAEAAIGQAQAQVAAAKSRVEVARLEDQRNQSLYSEGLVSRRQVELAGREYSEARANAVSAEKQVEIAKSGLNALQRQIEAERGRVKDANSRIAAAENDYRLSVAEIGLASSNANESVGRLESARALPARIAVEESSISSALAEVERTSAAVKQAEIEVAYTKILAPQDGYISRKNVQEGQLVQPDQALLTITQGGIWVVANFKETQLEQIRPGQAVDIYVDAYPSATFRGRVESFQAGTGSRFSLFPAENATGNFVKVVQRVSVKIVFDEEPDKNKYMLVPGMSVLPRIRVR